MQERCCCKKEYYPQINENEMNAYDNYKQIQIDYDYFFKEDWITSINKPLFDPEKFIFLYNLYQQD